MVGAGALAGSLSGGNTNAARSPLSLVPSEFTAPVTPPGPATSVPDNTVSSEAIAPQAPELAPAAAIAMRFPPRWHVAAPAAEPVVPSRAMAYAPEPAPPAAPQAGYQLASIDPAPAPLPPRRAAKPQPRNQTLFNDAQLASIKSRLKLSPQQEQYWPQVEQALRAISYKLAKQQDSKRPVKGNPASMIDPDSPEVARLKNAAFPLIMSLRAEQKEEVRQLAHTMGLSKVATMF